MKESLGPNQKRLGSDNESNLPLNWPKGVPLPTVEEVRGSTQDFEEKVKQKLDLLKGKLDGVDSDMLKTVLDI